MNRDNHASLEQLLEIKDGVHNAAAEHVAACKLCQNEIEGLRTLAKQMFEEANKVPDARVWDRISHSVALSKEQADELDYQRGSVPLAILMADRAQASNISNLNNVSNLSKAVYSLAASILITGFIGLFLYGQQNVNTSTQNELLYASIQELMLNSRGMERTLEKVAMQNELLTSSEQSAAERLYWRLNYVDQMIDENSNDGQGDPARIKMLWNDRIQALTQLNQIYYQRQQTFDDSEI